jgi:hypothetical protein
MPRSHDSSPCSLRQGCQRLGRSGGATVGGTLLLGVSILAWVPAAQAEDVLPVWVLIDDDTPVADARVQVIAQGRPLRQADGRADERSNEDGVVGLSFESLPPSFTVKASGGRADGRRLRGSLRTQVQDYQPGTIVYLTPATTLLSEVRERDPSLGDRAATRRVKCMIGIPRWHDLTSDLQRSDHASGAMRFSSRPAGVAGSGG